MEAKRQNLGSMAPSNKDKQTQKGDADLLAKLREIREKEDAGLRLDMGNGPDEDFKLNKKGKANFAQDEAKFLMGSSKPEQLLALVK
jgi:hypothetical protein